MADTSMPCDMPSWAFDPMNPGPGFSLGPTFTTDEEMLYRSQFGLNDFDLATWQSLPADAGAGYEFGHPASGKAASNIYNDHRQSSQSQPPVPVDHPYGFGWEDKGLSRFGNFHTAQDPLAADDGTSYTLDDLLRSASHVATERALYMNAPAGTPSVVQGSSPSSHRARYQSPIPDPCIGSPSETSHRSSSASEADWERDQELENMAAATTAQVYRLPAPDAESMTPIDGYFSPMHDHVAAGFEPQSAVALTTPVPGSAGDKNNYTHLPQKLQTIATTGKSYCHRPEYGSKDYTDCLTPLEMPDGTTRFTSNWLPVDPEGGFTIRTPATPMPATDSRFDLDLNLMGYPSDHYQDYSQHAFISIDAGLSQAGV